MTSFPLAISAPITTEYATTLRSSRRRKHITLWHQNYSLVSQLPPLITIARASHFTRCCRCDPKSTPVLCAVLCAAKLPGASGERHEVAEVIDQGEDQVAHGVCVLKTHKVDRVEW